MGGQRNAYGAVRLARVEGFFSRLAVLFSLHLCVFEGVSR